MDTRELAVMLSKLTIEQIKVIERMINDLNAHDQKLKPKLRK